MIFILKQRTKLTPKSQTMYHPKPKLCITQNLKTSPFILSLPFRTDTSYRERLSRLNMLPVTYWHEYLDFVYLYKAIASDTDTNIRLKFQPARPGAQIVGS